MRQTTDNDMQGLHIASLTHSEMIVLNLPELQRMTAFNYELALLEENDTRIHAYQHGQQSHSYLITVPLTFMDCQKNRTKMFIELMCLSSQTITVPAEGHYQQEIEELLERFCLNWQSKRGNSVVKLYIQGECWNSYLDFVTFQAVQFKGKNSKELISLKKQNAFEYCLNFFKQELLPYVYQNQEDSIEQALQCCTQELKGLFLSLECSHRFQIIYQLMNVTGCSLSELQSQIQKTAIGRCITTVGDEECQQLINEQLNNITENEINSHELQLLKMRPADQPAFLTKILNNLMTKLRSYSFEIDDKKILFLNNKIIEKVIQINSQKTKQLEEDKTKLNSALLEQEKEINRLKMELETIKTAQSNTASAKKQIALEVIVEQQEENAIVKGIASPVHTKPKTPLSIKELKEPLHALTSNALSNKLQKTSLGKAKEKLKEGLKKQEDLRKQKSMKTMKLAL